MSINDKDIKLLWGNAAGLCSNPSCRVKVIEKSSKGESYLTGEMAHNVARRIGGPRSDGKGGDDTYDNLLLLCPTCHTKIDKAPEGEFDSALLRSWKETHEAWIEGLLKAPSFNSWEQMKNAIRSKVSENQYYFKRYGPLSQVALNNPVSDAYAVWQARKLDTILPNNSAIVSILEQNQDLIPEYAKTPSIAFIDHAKAYRENQISLKADYPNFPVEFEKAILGEN